MSYQAICDECGIELDPEYPMRVIPGPELSKHRGAVMIELRMTLHDRDFHLCNDCTVKLIPWLVRPDSLATTE